MKFIKRERSEGLSGGHFLKLKDGESVTGVFRGEIFEFKTKWNGTKYVDDPAGSPRFKLNFVMKEGQEYVAKVFEFPATIYDNLAAINESMALEKTLLKITRKGTGTDTIYIIIPLGALSAPQLSQVSGVSLQTLGAQKKSEPDWAPAGPEDFGGSDYGPRGEEELPF